MQDDNMIRFGAESVEVELASLGGDIIRLELGQADTRVYVLIRRPESAISRGFFLRLDQIKCLALALGIIIDRLEPPIEGGF